MRLQPVLSNQPPTIRNIWNKNSDWRNFGIERQPKVIAGAAKRERVKSLPRDRNPRGQRYSSAFRNYASDIPEGD
jgi:hypothetical protein